MCPALAFIIHLLSSTGLFILRDSRGKINGARALRLSYSIWVIQTDRPVFQVSEEDMIYRKLICSVSLHWSIQLYSGFFFTSTLYLTTASTKRYKYLLPSSKSNRTFWARRSISHGSPSAPSSWSQFWAESCTGEPSYWWPSVFCFWPVRWTHHTFRTPRTPKSRIWAKVGVPLLGVCLYWRDKRARYAKVDRRPLDPPPIVLLRLLESGEGEIPFERELLYE